ncbi:MAG TPA: hypothetical protein VER03_12900 [Bryobacteraceae bacterium]|nr:hypothetical protein [Bryobacteraceae bacterium]
MIMQKPRTRLLSLRVTDEEYRRLRDTAEGQGARSVSDFARTALLASAHPGATGIPLWRQPLDALAERIAKLEHDVAQVKQLLL